MDRRGLCKHCLQQSVVGKKNWFYYRRQATYCSYYCQIRGNKRNNLFGSIIVGFLCLLFIFIENLGRALAMATLSLILLVMASQGYFATRNEPT